MAQPRWYIKLAITCSSPGHTCVQFPDPTAQRCYWDNCGNFNIGCWYILNQLNFLNIKWISRIFLKKYMLQDLEVQGQELYTVKGFSSHPPRKKVYQFLACVCFSLHIENKCDRILTNGKYRDEGCMSFHWTFFFFCSFSVGLEFFKYKVGEIFACFIQSSIWHFLHNFYQFMYRNIWNRLNVKI